MKHPQVAHHWERTSAPSIFRTFRLPVLLLVPAAILGALSRTPGWTRADLQLDETVQAVRAPWLTVVARGLDTAFSPVAAVCLTALLAAVLIAIGRGRTAVITVLVIIGGWGTGSIFKTVVARPRPPLDHQLVVQYGHDSYPSGHVAITLSMVVAIGLLAYGSRWFRPVVVVGAVLVTAQALARLYLGVHYPTDVIGSILVAPAGAFTVIALWRRFVPFSEEGGTHPAATTGPR
ncbi:phosphatase PAP2 family protein [Streptosporangium sp. NPDC087985]|uniref:phosphatase PAP2 family protein n=1 Tax=Streptosporangium sp. NPDC087985 TaxID=3366196 RepID=UPI0037F9CE83